MKGEDRFEGLVFGKNNSYYFVEERISYIVIESWKILFPALDCKSLSKGRYNEYIGDYNYDDWLCDEVLDDISPEDAISFFDI